MSKYYSAAIAINLNARRYMLFVVYMWIFPELATSYRREREKKKRGEGGGGKRERGKVVKERHQNEKIN